MRFGAGASRLPCGVGGLGRYTGHPGRHDARSGGGQRRRPRHYGARWRSRHDRRCCGYGRGVRHHGWRHRQTGRHRDADRYKRHGYGNGARHRGANRYRNANRYRAALRSDRVAARSAVRADGYARRVCFVVSRRGHERGHEGEPSEVTGGSYCQGEDTWQDSRLRVRRELHRGHQRRQRHQSLRRHCMCGWLVNGQHSDANDHPTRDVARHNAYHHHYADHYRGVQRLRAGRDGRRRKLDRRRREQCERDVQQRAVGRGHRGKRY